MCLFIRLSVKAVHLELLSDLTTEALISELHWFINRCRYALLVLRDHGTNCLGAKQELKKLKDFFGTQQVIRGKSCITKWSAWINESV